MCVCVKLNALTELLLPQHFAPFHEFFRLFIQNQRFDARQKVFRSEAALSWKYSTKKEQTETKSCVELRVHFRWRRSTSKISCSAADDGVLLLSRWSQLILLMVLILQSQQKKGTWLKRYNCTKIGHTTCVSMSMSGGAGTRDVASGSRKISSWWWWW